MSKQETDKMNVKHESQIEDLPVADEQAEEIKAGAEWNFGGPACGTYRVSATWVG